MNGLIGLIVGIAVTVAVARYYYQRSTHKRLAAYLLLSNHIFGGIESEFRKELRFTFRETEVVDLHQIEFLIANDGERSISSLIEPLRLEIPKSADLLDASILYRSPTSLGVNISPTSVEGRKFVQFDFPLLNRGEFFLVKLLLGGRLRPKDLVFTVLADDLPRTIDLEPVPSWAMEEKIFSIEWSAVFVGIVILSLVAAFSYPIYLAFKHQPDLVPYPLHGYHFSLSFLIIAIDLIGLVILTAIGIVLTVGVGLADAHLGGNRFPLPKELKRGRFPFGLMNAMQYEGQTDLDRARASASGAAREAKPVATTKLPS
jgi:hypothetical protein